MQGHQAGDMIGIEAVAAAVVGARGIEQRQYQLLEQRIDESETRHELDANAFAVRFRAGEIVGPDRRADFVMAEVCFLKDLVFDQRNTHGVLTVRLAHPGRLPAGSRSAHSHLRR